MAQDQGLLLALKGGWIHTQLVTCTWLFSIKRASELRLPLVKSQERLNPDKMPLN